MSNPDTMIPALGDPLPVLAPEALPSSPAAQPAASPVSDAAFSYVAPGGEMSLYVGIFAINGRKHTITGHALTAKHAIDALKAIVAHRNRSVPTEQTEAVGVHFGLMSEQQQKIVNEVRGENPETSLSEEMSPQDRALLLHKPEGDAVFGGGVT